METSLYCNYVLVGIFLHGLRKSSCLFQVSSQRDESELLLNLPPDRIGHGTFLHPEFGGSDSLVDKVCKQNIPIGKSFPMYFQITYLNIKVFFFPSVFFFLLFYFYFINSFTISYLV